MMSLLPRHFANSIPAAMSTRTERPTPTATEEIVPGKTDHAHNIACIVDSFHQHSIKWWYRKSNYRYSYRIIQYCWYIPYISWWDRLLGFELVLMHRKWERQQFAGFIKMDSSVLPRKATWQMILMSFELSQHWAGVKEVYRCYIMPMNDFISFINFLSLHMYKNIKQWDLQIRVECRKKDTKRKKSLIKVLLTNHRYIYNSNESSMQL